MWVVVIVLTILFIALALLVVAELCARWWLPRHGRSYSLVPYSKLRMHLDRKALPTLEPVIEYRVNSQGERGDEPPADSTGLFRVLVAGGSAAECWLIDQKSSWPNVVQDQLHKPEHLARLGATSVHVGNIGRSGLISSDVDVVLERVLANYERLGAIVLLVGAGDIVRWLEKGTPYAVGAATRVQPNSVLGQYPDGPFGWRWKNMASRRIAVNTARRIVSMTEVRRGVGKRIGEARAMRQRAQAIVRDIPDPTPMLENYAHWLASAINRAREKTATVLVLRQPWLEKQFSADEEKLLWNYGLGKPYAGEVTAYYSHEVAWSLHREVDRITVQIATELNVATLELMSAIEPSFRHFYDDLHYTPEGCKVIGEAVADALVGIATKQ